MTATPTRTLSIIVCGAGPARDLRAEGIQVLLGTGGFEPHQPGSGDEQITAFGWNLALDAAEQAWETTHPVPQTSTR